MGGKNGPNLKVPTRHSSCTARESNRHKPMTSCILTTARCNVLLLYSYNRRCCQLPFSPHGPHLRAMNYQTRDTMSTQDSSSRAVQVLLSHIDQGWTTSCAGPDALSSTFVSQAAIKDYFRSSPQIPQLVEAACGTDSTPNARWITENCPIGFCILLSLGKGGYVRHFVEHVGLWDVNLPFSARPEDFPQVPNEPEFFDTFRLEQWRFFPVEIPRSPAVKFQKDRPLPIVESEVLKYGDTANLYRVKIHREYDNAITNDEVGLGPSTNCLAQLQLIFALGGR